MKPASRKPSAISFQSIVQSPRKLAATSAQASARGEALAPARAAPSPSPWCSWPACASWAWRRACSSSRGETKRRSSTAISAIRTMPPTYSASANCQPDQHPEDQPQLPDQVGRGELEGERGDRRGALLEERLGDRDRRVGAGGGGGAEPGRLRHRDEAVAGERRLRSARAGTQAWTIGRDREAEHQRPPDLVGHQEGLFEALADLVERRRSPADEAAQRRHQLVDLLARSPPSASTTQWRVCSSSRPSATLSSAAWIAPIWVSTSMQ